MRILEFDETTIGNPAMVLVLKQIDKHAVDTTQRLSSIETKMEVIVGAFPANDFEGHRRYHQSLIEALEEKRAFYRAIKEKSLTGLIWAAVVWLGVAIWHEILSQISGSK